MTTNHVENLDPALIRKGRVDINIELKSCDRYQIASIYEKIIKKTIPTDILNKCQEFKYKPIDIITHILRHQICDLNLDTMMEIFY
jgi:SpoVK/Ycf46/Vps4 family AAA+-type ATPase